MTIIEFGEYLPDLPAYGNQGATVATNVIPQGNSYSQFPSLEVFSGALTARAQGLFVSRDFAGTVYSFAGDVGKLYELTNATWGDVSVGGGYTVPDDDAWTFDQWGEKVIASQISQYPQQFTMGTSSAFTDLTTDLKGKYVAVVRDFVVFGHTWDSVDTTRPNRVRWSAIGDETDYTVSSTTQSDYQDLEGKGGFIVGLVGGEFGTIFMEKSVWRMTYTGSATVFEFDEVEKERGCPASGSIVKVGGWVAYLSDDGFYIFDGDQSIPISHNKTSTTFWADVNTQYLSRICSTVDLQRQIIIWAYPSTASQDGTPDKMLIYNYTPGSKRRWATVNVSVETLGRVITGGYTLEQLDNVDSNLDTLTPSLDSRYWTAGDKNLAAFNTDHKLVTFSGTGMDAVLETGEVEMNKYSRTRLTKVRPLVDGANAVTLQISGRNRLQDAVSWDAAATVPTSGNVSVRNNSRYHRIRANITGGFTHAQGIDTLEAYKAGKR